MCGTPTPPAKWFMVGVGESSGAIVRERAKQIQLLNQHLSGLRINVSASPANPGLTLRTPDGRSEFILDIGDAWPAVERLAGRPYDPLGTTDTAQI
ncbi:hypothetical protein [Orrella sp. 11846]|uniref:hypothetical protein n=1 Tax=Orrella sp. 11846 TaxID=3409913 RepID=UPI003B59BEC0